MFIIKIFKFVGYNFQILIMDWNVPRFFRQRKLEEALLFSGQFSEALQALLDWLAKVEPTLVEDQPVYGDVFTVNNLMEIHKVCQRR